MVQWRTFANGWWENAVAGGTDVTGELLFIGRAFHNGEMVPGKIVPSQGCLIISDHSTVIRVTNFEYLVRPKKGELVWVSSSNGQVPSNSIPAGDDGRNSLFIGRAQYGGSLVIGKVHPANQCCFLPYQNQEIVQQLYEVLTYNDENGVC